MEKTIYCATFTFEGIDEFLVRSDRPVAYMVMRDRFDYFLAEKAQRAGAKVFHFHDLRRVFGTKLEELGYGEKYIAELLGHASTESTRIYIEISEKRKREAIEKVYFNGLQ